MMCPPARLNDRLTKDWEYVRSYTINNGHLFLSLMADGGNYEFEPVSREGSVKGAVKGTAIYRERVALPPDAVFEATLEDVSRADAAAEVIGQARIEEPGNPPIRFEIAYDHARIQPSHRYVIRARVLVGGKPFFTTDQYYPVLTAGQGNEVELLLRRTGASSPAGGAAGAPGSPPGTSGGDATEALENTYWKLTRLGDAPVIVASEQREPHLILNSETRRVAGSGGCNRLTGSYELNGDQLTLGQMAGTMMACLEGMETEKLFLEALKHVSRWTIAGQQLDLFDAAGNAVACFEARHSK
jgi:putative lipoprotein